MQHMLHTNLALCLIRNSRGHGAVLPFVAEGLVGKDAISSLDNCRVFPLYLYEEYHGKMQKVSNLNPEIVKKITAALGEAPTPEDIFNYIYAVLHSPSYREKYKEFLKIDFPRIPYPTSAETFHALAALGAQLVAIHTMKDFDEADDVAFDGDDLVVGKVTWKDGAAYINKESCFTGVDEATFNQYIGGYQPLQKWLKDRKGRTLSDADISHYKRIVRALRRTAELMTEIDKVFTAKKYDSDLRKAVLL
jgi:predicted helicase